MCENYSQKRFYLADSLLIYVLFEKQATRYILGQIIAGLRLINTNTKQQVIRINEITTLIFLIKELLGHFWPYFPIGNILKKDKYHRIQIALCKQYIILESLINQVKNTFIPFFHLLMSWHLIISIIKNALKKFEDANHKI